MNGLMSRIKSPQPLANGDRLAIGIYVIAIEIEPNTVGTEPFSPASDRNYLQLGQSIQYDAPSYRR